MDRLVLQPTVELDAIRTALAADVAMLFVPLGEDRLRLVASAGGAGEPPDEVITPQGSLLARILVGGSPGRVPRLPLLSGTARRSRSYGPSLVVRTAHAELGDAVLVLSRRQHSRPFEDVDLRRVGNLAAHVSHPAAHGISLLDLDALGGDATFREAFEVASVGMSLVDPALRYRWVNGPLCEMLGRRRSELIGMPVIETVHPDHLGRISVFYERLRREGSAARDRLRFQRPDGADVWADIGGSVVDTAPHSPLYLVQQFDATAEQAAADELAHRVMHDEMTGLANRALFRDRLQALLSRALRGGSRAAVFFLDLDRFKDVNDTWGHAVGDTVLVETARRLSGVVRAGDTVARFGGDEFVVASEVLGASDAAQLATRIGVALRPGIDIGDGRTIQVSASVGVALSRPLDAPDDLVGRADIALLDAKRLRRLHLVADDAAIEPVAAPAGTVAAESAALVVVRPDFDGTRA